MECAALMLTRRASPPLADLAPHALAMAMLGRGDARWRGPIAVPPQSVGLTTLPISR